MLLWNYNYPQKSELGWKGLAWNIEITSWKVREYGIFTRVGAVSEIERVSTANEWDFWYFTKRVWKSRTKRFPCCNLFISYILRFSQTQINILALDKFELRTTRVHRKYYLVKPARRRYPRWPRKSPRKSPRKHNSLKPWFVIGRNDFFTCEKLVSPLWLVEVKSKRLFHTAKFAAKISVCMK